MKRICGWCLKTIGHKCPACGKDAKVVAALGMAFCTNPSCKLLGFAIDGKDKRESHGICISCKGRMLLSDFEAHQDTARNIVPARPA